MGTQAYWFQGPYRWRSSNDGSWTYATLLSDVREDFLETDAGHGEVEKIRPRSGETLIVWRESFSLGTPMAPARSRHREVAGAFEGDTSSVSNPIESSGDPGTDRRDRMLRRIGPHLRVGEVVKRYDIGDHLARRFGVKTADVTCGRAHATTVLSAKSTDRVKCPACIAATGGQAAERSDS